MAAILAFCLKNWRWLAYAAAAVAALWVALLVRHWHEDSTVALPKAQAALLNEQGCGSGSKCAERVAALVVRQKAVDEQVARDYETKLAEIAARPAPSGPVRLCRPANNRVRVSSTAPAVSPSDGAELPLEAGRDIAVELYKLADDADTEALKLQALWQRDTALATPPTK